MIILKYLVLAMSVITLFAPILFVFYSDGPVEPKKEDSQMTE